LDNEAMTHAAYPRPMMRRDHWKSLNGTWRFTFDDELVYERPADITRWPAQITVPFAPEAAASGIGDRGFHRACWYQRQFDIAADGGRVLLHFGAVDYEAEVWVNGYLVAYHQGGHTPFCADITFALNPSGTHMLTVRVRDDPHDLTKPRGKQDWQLEPHSMWYPRTSGIWQTVWLERVARTYIEKLRWTPNMEGFEIAFDALIGGDPCPDLNLEVTLKHRNRLLAMDSYRVMDCEAVRRIVLSDPGIDDSRNELLWSPERPTLIDAHIVLKHGARVLDEVFSYTALRSVNIVRDRFMLNGRPYMLRMVLDQGYWPDTLLTAPDDDALRRDVELAKAMGFNGVRKHQKIEDPRFLYWADRLGLLVWEEMPSAYRFTSRTIHRLVREWTEAIDRDYSHPCIAVWVPFNESWGVPDLPSTKSHRHAVEALYHLTKTLDATRPVIGNDGWESSATDIIGIHDYDANPERIRDRYGPEVGREELFDRRRPGGRVLTLDGYPHRGQPVMLTECGGIAFTKVPVTDRSAWGYLLTHSEEELYQRFLALMEVVNKTALLSGWCYTQFADTFQEANGLLYADRTPKVPIELIAAATQIQRSHIQGTV
jgi:hypothetical protein